MPHVHRKKVKHDGNALHAALCEVLGIADPSKRGAQSEVARRLGIQQPTYNAVVRGKQGTSLQIEDWCALASEGRPLAVKLTTIGRHRTYEVVPNPEHEPGSPGPAEASSAADGAGG